MKHLPIGIAVLALTAAACGSATDTAATTLPPTTAAVETTTSQAPTTTTTTTTSVVETTTTAATSEADKDAITAAYEIVFSSETTYEEKAPLIDDPDGLEDTVAKYEEAGEAMGGVSLVAKKITVSGDVADVIYDFLFGGTPTYPDLEGDAVLVDGTWKITREMFCSIMTSARVGCPAP